MRTIKISKEELNNKIQKLDNTFLTLKDVLGIDHADVLYVKGHRDALVDIYNNY